MHTPTGLENQRPNPSPEARGIAAAVPLIHTGRFTEPEFREILKGGPLTPPPPAEKQPGTLAAESTLNIQPSIYFYAGRNYPKYLGFLEVALPQPDPAGPWEYDPSEAGFSPFDTGGFGSEPPKIAFACHPDTPAGRRAYLKEHTAGPADAVAYLARFLDLYFAAPADYWETPSREIDGVGLGVLNDEENWRHWTMEARVAGAVDTRDARLALGPTEQMMYNQALRNGDDPVPAIPNGRRVSWDTPGRRERFDL